MIQLCFKYHVANRLDAYNDLVPVLFCPFTEEIISLLFLFDNSMHSTTDCVLEIFSFVFFEVRVSTKFSDGSKVWLNINCILRAVSSSQEKKIISQPS